MKFDERILKQDFLPTPVKLDGVWKIFPAATIVPNGVDPIEYSEKHYHEMIKRGFPKGNNYHNQFKDIWLVKSKSTSGKHKVELTKFGWRCDCDGFRWRGNCSHIKKIKNKIERKNNE